MNKEIEEMAKVICNECKNNAEYCAYRCVSKEKPCSATIRHAENIYNAGYRKQVWHKVDDGDLPIDNGLYLCFCKYNASSKTFYDLVHIYDFENYNVIAWCEIPEYEGEERNDK